MANHKPATAALAPSVVWKGRNVKLVLVGKRFVNSPEFTETYPIEIEECTDEICLAGIIAECLDAIASKSEMPADLIRGVQFEFVP